MALTDEDTSGQGGLTVDRDPRLSRHNLPRECAPAEVHAATMSWGDNARCVRRRLGLGGYRVTAVGFPGGSTDGGRTHAEQRTLPEACCMRALLRSVLLQALLAGHWLVAGKHVIYIAGQGEGWSGRGNRGLT